MLDGVRASAAGSVMVAFTVSVHPFASVTVRLYVPAVCPVRSSAVSPPGAQLYV